ncbi:MAG: SAM-dependent methyltransferase [Burkholderiaceae bacterium]
MNPPFDADAFERLFARDDDPWAFATRWYEARKRALTLACLPAPRYAQAFEPACANGLLTAELAARCDRLLAVDVSARAVELTRDRIGGAAHVELRVMAVPERWPAPDRRFDLIVLSEFGYYLDAARLRRLAELTRASLSPTGVVVACHWRHPIEGCPLRGDEVQRRLDAGLRLPRSCAIDDADFRLDVWSADSASPARREGLV